MDYSCNCTRKCVINYTFRHQQVVFESIIFNTTEVAEAVLNQYVEWSPEAAIALQESVIRGELIFLLPFR